MDSVFQSFLGIFFLVILLILGMGVIASSIDSTAAERALSDYSRRIEDSYFDPDVMECCRQDAADHDRQLEIKTYRREGESEDSYGWARLTYEISIPVIGYTDTRSLVTDLR